MQVRQLWCVQGSCDVGAVMCVRACDFVWVYVCVWLWFWLLNDERWGCVRGYAPICEQWTLYRSCALWLINKIAHAMMSKQLAEGEIKVQSVSIWGQNVLLEGLGECLWIQELTFWLWFWLLNDERWGRVRGYAPICEQWTPYRSCALWLINKIAHAMMSEQLAEGENKVQSVSIWGQNVLLGGLGRCLWDQEPTLMWPKWFPGRFPQFRYSILEAFWASFWKTWQLKRRHKMKSVSDILLGSKFGKQMIEFGIKLKRRKEDTLL